VERVVIDGETRALQGEEREKMLSGLLVGELIGPGRER
jgi:hypothetical protein